MLRPIRRAAQAGVIALSCLSAPALAQQPQLLPAPVEGAVADAEAPAVESRPAGPLSEVVAPGAGGGAVAGPFGGYPYSGGWHAGYQHPMYGRPVALVVPPVSHYQTIYSWGVATTQMTPIAPQYDGPGYGAPWTDPGQYHYPPYWPWDTRQFGVYYIRGPW